jgi:hypothetical protein
MDDALKIISLEAQNVMCLKAVRITPEGNLVVIGGENGQGKSAALNCIIYGVEGKGAICKEPLRRGEKNGFTALDLGDIKIRRTFTEGGGGTLTVTNKDGMVYKSPQAILDGLYGKIAFDPVAFANEKDKQLERLKKLVGLDFTDLDAKRKALFDSRTVVNRDGKAMKARLDAIPIHTDAPEPVSVAALMKELKAAQSVNAANLKKRNDLERMELDHGSAVSATETAQEAAIEKSIEIDSEIAELRAKILELGKKADAEKEKVKKMAESIEQGETLYAVEHEKQKAVIAALVDVDEESMQAKINGAEVINEKVRSNAARKALDADVDAKRKESQSLTEQIEAIDAEKSQQLSAAKFPVPGLSFNETGVTFNGLPFEQASSAEQLRVSMAMGIAMNPKLRVLIIKDGSLLDSKSLKLVAEFAAANDAQVWMERVGQGQECQVIIEDGMVKHE